MASSIGPTRGSDRTAMERFGDRMALLPWTKQILCVLWEQLRLLVHVIYYSFLSVFQMFRFEVHLRITDETGQHMSATSNSAESFLLSSLFDGENGVMVGGSNPLSNFCSDGGDFPGGSHAGALLSTLSAEELCCGLVDDFVSRATDCFPNNEDGLCLGHHPSWKLGFPGDWNIFLTSSDSSGSDETCYKSTEKTYGTSGEEKDLWSNDADQNMEEFDSEDSKALWESLSRSSDPYNPLFFNACISSTSNMGKTKKEEKDSECIAPSKLAEDFQGLSFWVSRSDSENSCSSWGSSDSSCAELDRGESDRQLWDLFSSSADPYNPLCFTACTVTTAPQQDTTLRKSAKATLPALQKNADIEERGGSTEEDEEQLWRSLSQENDPYHPLNFRACLQTSPTTTDVPRFHFGGDPDTPPDSQTPRLTTDATEKEAMPPRCVPQITRPNKPTSPMRHLKKHCHDATTVVPWRRSERKEGVKEGRDSPPQKRVRFSPVVNVHVMRTWLFARQASRKGPWEELARDRDRFRRRIQETQDAIGYCFSPSHREKILAYLDSTSTSNTLN